MIISKFRHIAVAVMLLTFAACSQDDDNNVETGHAPSLQINVSAQGFTGEGTQLRASDIGYTTTFAAGNQIGITAIKNGTATQDNIAFRYNGTGWEAANSTEGIFFGADAYLVYYPYSAAMNGLTTAAEIVAAFTPKTAQSNYADYTASDLMTGSGTVSGTTLNVTLTHVLALVEINMPKQTYVGSPNNFEQAGILSGGLTVNGVAVAPYDIVGGFFYRYLVKPSSTVSIGGKYRLRDLSYRNFSVSAINAEAGKYTPVNITHAGFVTAITPKAAYIGGCFWALANVDAPGTFAASPAAFGMLYQWDSKVGWSPADPLTSSPAGNTWNPGWNGGFTGGGLWSEANDPSPAGWRLPTYDEFNDCLLASGVYATVSGQAGWIFGNGNNTIFLPFAGRRNTNRSLTSTTGSYWDNEAFGYSNRADLFYFTSSIAIDTDVTREFGYSIRPVAKD